MRLGLLVVLALSSFMDEQPNTNQFLRRFFWTPRCHMQNITGPLYLSTHLSHSHSSLQLLLKHLHFVEGAVKLEDQLAGIWKSRTGRLGYHCSSTSNGNNRHNGRVCWRKAKTLQAHLAAHTIISETTPKACACIKRNHTFNKYTFATSS